MCIVSIALQPEVMHLSMGSTIFFYSSVSVKPIEKMYDFQLRHCTKIYM